MADVLSTMKNTLSSEVRALEHGADSVIDGLASKARAKFGTVLDDLYRKIKDAGEIVASDVESVLAAAKTAAEHIEEHAEKAYNGFVKKANHTIGDMKSAGSKVVSDVESASHYLRNHAAADMRSAGKAAEADFAKAKDDFTTGVKTMGDDIYNRIKEGVEAIVADAHSDLTKVEALKSRVEGDIDSKVEAIKHGVIAFKDDAVKEMEKIVSLIRTEVEKMEKDVKGVKKLADDVQWSVGMSILGVGLAAAGGIVIWKLASRPSVNGNQQASQQGQLPAISQGQSSVSQHAISQGPSSASQHAIPQGQSLVSQQGSSVNHVQTNLGGGYTARTTINGNPSVRRVK